VTTKDGKLWVILDGMAKAPTAALVMHPVVREELVRDDHMQRLERAVALISHTPYRDLDQCGDNLKQIEVLITSWGCPESMPRASIVCHA
jgi:hypothetical protein